MLSLPSSSSSISQKKYDVFLSFRGEDTRKSFTDHLYAALKRSGIITFMDDEKLEAGEAIRPELFKATQESWCSVIVLSKTYAFSGWCLDELAEIVKQKKERGHKVFPIFYDVDPTDLRKHTGRVQEAFADHEERYKENKDKIRRWRSALTQVADMKGWHLNNRHESEFIEDIVRRISTKLWQTYSSVPNELIGINSHLEELYSKIDIGEDDVCVIGICGMGGIGKTTLARVVYAQMSPHFEGKSFLADVREVSEKCGLVSLQKQLLSQMSSEETFNIFDVQEGKAMISHRLSHKKVLVVIDDADNVQHLKCLVARRDWFGLGSRIIITTRDEHLLQSYEVDDVFKPATLDDNEALRLFSLKAFKNDTLENDFIELSKHVVRYADGLPLALEVLGSFLCGRDATQWTSAIQRLNRDSNKEIHDRLQISFDGLEETEKNIFLDIACFFKGEEKDFVIKVLDGCEFFPDIGIDVLIKKSLIKVDGYNKSLGMHDLLQEMGRKIVKQKSIDEPGKRCRLWEERDVYHVLTKNTGTEAIEGMVIDNMDGCLREQKKSFTLGVDAFLKMKKLRLLKVFDLPNSPDLKYLSNELRLFEWHGYPLRSLPSSFRADNLVALLMPYSRIEQLWKGNVHLEKLKLINLEGCRNLIKTPDFTMAPNLESLILEGCTRIIDVHPSITLQKKLKLLNLRDCKRLRSFPSQIGMESLETLILSGCSNLGELPSSIGNLSSLVLLNLKDCRNLLSLPSSIHGLKSLKTLNLSGCSKVENLPESLQQIEYLEELDLSQTAIREPASFIFQFRNLKVLSFSGCGGAPSKLPPILPSLFNLMQWGSTNSTALMLPPLSGLSCLTELNLSDCNLCEGAIPSDISYLSSLAQLDLSGNNFISLPATLTRLSKLSDLYLRDCEMLKSLPKLPSSITKLSVLNCASLEAFENPTTICTNSIDHISICLSNCFRLAVNNNVFTMLKKHIKVFANPIPLFDVVMPGSEIPEWLGHQTDESSIKVALPPNSCNDRRWVGIVFCCVYASVFNDDVCRDKRKIVHGRNCREEVHNFRCTFVIHGRNCREEVDKRWETKNRSVIRKDHLWLFYLDREELFKDYRFPGQIKSADECSELEVGLTPGETTSHKVKKCGLGFVYGKDFEELEQIQDQLLQISANFDDFPHDTALVKRKRSIYEEAGSSGSDSAEERPQPKRLEKIFNLITGKKHSG